MMPAVYLASPYSHPDPEVRLSRFNAVMAAGAWLLSRRIWYFSPVQYTHILALRFKLPTDAAFWWDYNRAMIEAHGAVMAFCAEGWRESKGMKQELEYAEVQGLQVQYLMPFPDGEFMITDSPSYEVIRGGGSAP